MVSHCGRDSTIQEISNIFFWHNIKGDIEEFIKKCDQCQKLGKIEKVSSALHRIPIKTEVMQQIGIDICILPEVVGFNHLVVCIDYFSVWSEVKSIKDESASTIAQFLYEVICRHGCMKIQINGQWREFVNEVSNVLHNMIGTEQRITSAYQPQSNGICKRQNRTIKYSLVKVHDGNPCDWPNITEGVLFAHRVSKYTSTKFSPFFLM